MAFMGMFIGAAAVFLAVLGFCNFVAIVCFIISAVLKRRYKKRAEFDPSVKTPVGVVVLKVTGWIFLLPLFGTIALVCIALVSTKIKHDQSLWYNVNTGNFAQVEKLIAKGASPNCTKDSNEPAKDGEISILVSLCMHHGFTVQNGFEDTKDHELTEDEKKMIQLLIDKGADMEYRYYYHEEHNFDNYYEDSDGCGSTPLLCAVRYGDYELVKLLVENGADINAKDAYGYNAAALVADELNDKYGAEIAQYLVDNGAETECTTKLGSSMYFLIGRNKQSGNEKIAEIFGYGQ